MAHIKKVSFNKKYSKNSKNDSETDIVSKNISMNIQSSILELIAENDKLKKYSSNLEDELLVSEHKSSLLNNSLLKCLHDTQEQLLFYRLKTDSKDIEPFEESISKKGNKEYYENISKEYYGARQRVENDLPYKLGRVIINYSDTPQNIAKIPKLLLEQYKDFLQNPDQSRLPPIEEYVDYKESEKIKQHLTYKVGLIAAESIKSPKNIIKMPFEITKQVFLFKKEK